MVMRRDFRSRVVLVSGAAGGLGAALCTRFAAAGASIAALDNSPERLDGLLRTLHAAGAQALALPTDITDAPACQRAVDAVLAQWGVIDLLINNAGISHRSLLAQTNVAVIRRVMEVNFFGAVNLTLAALTQLQARRGAIVTISSVAGFAPLIGRTGYSASKHALHGFFDSLRTELVGGGVDVTLVCPSFIRTGIGAAASGGSGAAVSTPRVMTGGESAPETVAQRVFDAAQTGQTLALPDATARKAWWLTRFAPALYARLMRARVGSEFAGLSGR